MPKSPAKAGKSGSPSKGEPVYLAVGALRRPHGVHGAILLEVYTDFPERLTEGTIVFIGGTHTPIKIRQLRHHNDGLLLGFDGFDTPEAVGRLRNQVVHVKTADRPMLPEGQFYHYQLIGIRVMEDSGNELGSLTDIIVTGANDVYVVTNSDGRELLLPAIRDVILSVDLKENSMTVHLIPGLIEKDQ